MRIRTTLAATAVAAVCVLAGAGTAAADATANGTAFGSPGVLSGNLIQIPIDLDLNLCGNSINLIGIANPAFGNTCINS
ncbi:chaplin [Kitasatospora aureofaciens]|uniref:chaplin n=1 Tax=Kitasatospora aureofaciens TaxID=1894 RepID=UPI001C47E81B|nr:chaplin [Kitasatospora aureofaciens]MBV6695870.1 chaplin [Kitasatospora aureofaciens]